MNECKDMEKQLILYLHDLLEDDEYKKVKQHLKICPVCRKKLKQLLKVKIYLNTTPGDTPPNNFNKILSSAKEKIQSNNIKKIYPILVIKQILKSKMILIAPILLFVLGVGIFIFQHKSNNLYIVKTYGTLFINNEKFKINKFKYNIDKKIDIYNQYGETIIQINDDKVILLKKNSFISVSANENIYITLKKGKVISRVKHHNKRGLILTAGKAKIKIVGTLFYFKRKNSTTELYVKKGTVEAKVNNKTYQITTHKLLTAHKNKTTIKNKIINNNTFKEIENFKFFDNFKNIKKIYIKTTPATNEVYINNLKIGITPIFTLINNTTKELTIARENYIPKNIPVVNNKNFHENITLKPIKIPELAWKLRLKNKIRTNPIYINNFIIVFDTSGSIYKINSITKKIVWKFKTKSRISSIPFYYNKKLYISANNDFLYAINFSSGALVNKARVGALVYSSPAIHKNKLFLCSNNGKITAVNINNFKILWKLKLDNGFFSTPIIYNGNLYIGGISGKFYSLNLKTRKINWIFKTKNRIVGITPIVKNNIIFFGSTDKYFYALNITSGNLIWKKYVNAPILSSPILIDNSIILNTIAGGVFSFSYASGSFNWKFNIRQRLLFKPYLVKNNYIFIGDRKYLYILTKNGIFIKKIKLNAENFIVTNNGILFVCRNDKCIYKLYLDL